LPPPYLPSHFLLPCLILPLFLPLLYCPIYESLCVPELEGLN
jgi:hypothetical protein